MVPEYKKPSNIIDLATRLSDLGYWPVPIPAGCKGPTVPGWQNLRLNFDTIPDHFAESGMLVGVLHTNVLALDIDVYDANLAREILVEAFRRFPGALERIGQAPKSALFFRMEEPGFKIKSTDRFEVIDEDTGETLTAQVEVRSVSRQIVAYGKHPETGRPYTWPRGELWETPWGDLPLADRSAIENFRDWCNDKIRKWAGVAPENVTSLDLHRFTAPTGERPSKEAFHAALAHVSANCPYDEWLNGLMGIHDYYNGSGEGLAAAKQWSSDFPDYSAKEVESKWRSFEPGKGVTYKSIFGMAKANGADMSAIARLDRKPAQAAAVDASIAADFTVSATAPVKTTSAADADLEPLPPFDTTPLTRDNLKGIAPRQWIYGNKLIRGFCTVMVSPGGTGKSAWAAAVACDMAGDRNSLHDAPHGRLKTWIYNLEDPRDETLRKIAAIDKARGLSNADLDNLVVTSGRDRSLIVAHEIERGVYVAAPDVDLLIESIKTAGIDVLIVDPAVRVHRLPENDNKAVDLMMDQFARIAHEANCAILLVHHTRKGFVAGEMDSMRGASSMGSAARIALTLQTMTQEEAVAMNIPEAERRLFVRLDNAKANLAPPSERAEWLKLESHNIGNPSPEYPDGDFVQVVTRWTPPNPWDDVEPFMFEIMERIDRGYVFDNGTTEPYGAAPQSKDKYVANAVLASFPNGDKSEKQAAAIINYWLGKGILEKRKYRNSNGDERTGVFVVNKEAVSNE